MLDGHMATDKDDRPWAVWIGDGAWRILSRHHSREGAVAFRDTVRASVGRHVPIRVDRATAVPVNWSVYEKRIGVELWAWVSEWPTYQSALTAAKVKRMQNSKMAYDVFQTGKEPRPEDVSEEWPRVSPTDTEVDMRERQRKIALLADEVRERVVDHPHRCRATRQNTGDICIRFENHSMDKADPNGGHLSPMEFARQQFERAERDPEYGHGEVPEAGTSAGRGWYPPHSATGREAHDPFRPGDPDDPRENPMAGRDVTPAGDGYAPGDPDRANTWRKE